METWKRTVYICAFCIFFMSLGISQVSPILPLYFHEMGLSDTGSIAQWSGASMGITFLIVCLAAPFWGRLADRKGRKITLIRSSLGMAICSILLGFQTTPEGVSSFVHCKGSKRFLLRIGNTYRVRKHRKTIQVGP